MKTADCEAGGEAGEVVTAPLLHSIQRYTTWEKWGVFLVEGSKLQEDE